MASTAVQDFSIALTEKREIAFRLGWVDIAQRYRRSKLGPFWITISMAVTIFGMGLVFGTIFGIPLRDFLPFLALGMIIWTFITSVITEGCTVFITSEGIIKQINLPFFTHIFRMIWRNFFIFGHNIVIFPLILLAFMIAPNLNVFLVVPGLLLLILNLTWVAMAAAIICTRYRDLTQIVVSVLQLWFFVTPIIWTPQLMIDKGRAVLLDINPFYHLIEITRLPLLGTAPTSLNWIVAVGLALVGWTLTMLLFNRYRRRIAYWL